jgi:hypothetical protein
MGPIGSPQRSVRNYRYSLHNSSEERGSQLLRGEGLKLFKSFLQLFCMRKFYNTAIRFVITQAYMGSDILLLHKIPPAVL